MPFRNPLPSLSTEDQQEFARHYHSSRAAKQADAEARSGDWAQAAVDYQKALSLWPINPRALYGLGRCADAAGDTATAIKYYRERIYKNHQATDATAPDQGYQENSPNRLMEYALLLDKTGQEGEALAVYRRALTTLNYDYDSIGPMKTRSVPRLDVLFPEFGPGEWAYTPQRLRAMIHLALGTYANNFGPALPHLQEAIRLAPDSAAACYYLGKYLLERDPVAAKAALQKAVQLGDDRTAKAAEVYLTVVR